MSQQVTEIQDANDIVEKIYFAAKHEDEDILQEYRNEINETTSNEKEIDYFRIKGRNATALHYACAKGDLNAVGLLLRYGADPSILDIGSSSWAPIHYAALLGHQNCVEKLFQYYPEIICCATGKERYHPIHTAVFAGDTALLEWLVLHGAEINQKDKRGNTPIHTAVYLGKKACIITLLNLGGDHLLTNKRKKCPIDLAKSKGYDDIAKILEMHHRNSRSIESTDNTTLIHPPNATDNVDTESVEVQRAQGNKKVNRRKRKEKNTNKMLLRDAVEGKILQKNFSAVCNEIDATILTDYLFEQELLTVNDLQELEIQYASTASKSRLLLLKLFNMEVKVFYSLMEWLKNSSDDGLLMLHDILTQHLQERKITSAVKKI